MLMAAEERTARTCYVGVGSGGLLNRVSEKNASLGYTFRTSDLAPSPDPRLELIDGPFTNYFDPF